MEFSPRYKMDLLSLFKLKRVKLDGILSEKSFYFVFSSVK
ncbi:hypothetical protein LEP1GSC036_4531 [Leptospira weilii str. 2006001853]|uniref:Uncharacterized protein n=1 Tax=Leptospira weilii str. 2006001853 TaxID=1001589 RepID=A0A828Z5K6_9LEPT|nr:hypothetical protein LEP1GSC036_4531 [Leptospira weilii str. 2006001853]EMJ66496.1 hypothetical protein LEP1GSC051_0489 [Leptospira sp. P2653]